MYDWTVFQGGANSLILDYTAENLELLDLWQSTCIFLSSWCFGVHTHSPQSLPYLSLWSYFILVNERPFFTPSYCAWLVPGSITPLIKNYLIFLY